MKENKKFLMEKYKKQVKKLKVLQGIYANIYTMGQAGKTKIAFFSDNLCSKMMCYVHLNWLWVYLSKMVKLPKFFLTVFFFYQISIFLCPCLTTDHVETSVKGEIMHFVYWFIDI